MVGFLWIICSSSIPQLKLLTFHIKIYIRENIEDAQFGKLRNTQGAGEMAFSHSPPENIETLF
jgi:hypothetical protein